MPPSRRVFLLWSFAAGLIGRSQHILAAVVSPTLPDNQLLDGTQSRCLQHTREDAFLFYPCSGQGHKTAGDFIIQYLQ